MKLKPLVVLLASSSMFAAMPAKADLYNFAYTATSGSYSATGTFETGALLGNSLGNNWYAITAISGTIFGTPGGVIDGISGGTILPPSYLTSASNSWYYDNALSSIGTLSASGGPLFTTGGGTREWNMWSTDVPGVTALWSAPTAQSQNWDVQTSGTLSVNAIPEPETYAMLLAGLGLLGWHARRRKLKLAAA